MSSISVEFFPPLAYLFYVFAYCVTIVKLYRETSWPHSAFYQPAAAWLVRPRH